MPGLIVHGLGILVLRLAYAMLKCVLQEALYGSVISLLCFLISNAAIFGIGLQSLSCCVRVHVHVGLGQSLEQT